MVDSNLRLFPGATSYDHDPNVILEMAKRGNLDEVLIIGFDQDGQLFVSASRNDLPALLWLLEKAKKMLLEVGDDG